MAHRESGMTSEHRDFARLLRKHQTPTEDMLWAQLRGSRFHGAKFRRQVPFDRYVADFYCHASKLVVELDGAQHVGRTQYDTMRTQVIERLGISVIRFSNEEVRDNLDAVLAKIYAALRLPFG